MNRFTRWLTKRSIEKAVFQKARKDLIDNALYTPRDQKLEPSEAIHMPYERFLGLGGLGGQTYQISGVVDFAENEEQKKRKGRVIYLKNISTITKSTTIAYQAHPEKIRHLVRLGLLKPQTITGIAIKGLGKYLLKVDERAVDDTIISNRSEQKDILINVYQDRVKLLQGLESLINNREKGIEEVIKIVNNYKKELEGYKEIYGKKLSEIMGDYDSAAKERYEGSIQIDIDNTKKFLKKLEYIQAVYGDSSDKRWDLSVSQSKNIFDFVVQQTKNALSYVEGSNQILTYNPKNLAFDRGDLNSFCVETRLEIDKYVNEGHDFHNRFLPEHSLDFKDEDFRTINLADYGITSKEEIDKFLLGVSVVEGTTKVDVKNKTLNGEELNETAATKWRHWRSFWGAPDPYAPPLGLRIATNFFNYVWPGLIISLANFMDVLIRGESAGIFAQAFVKLVPQENGKTSEHDTKKDFYALRHKAHNYDKHASTTLGLAARKLLVGVLWGNVKSVFIATVDFFGNFFSKLWFDTKNGFWGNQFRNLNPRNKKTDLLERLEKEIGEIKAIKEGAEKETQIKILAFQIKKEIDQWKKECKADVSKINQEKEFTLNYGNATHKISISFNEKWEITLKRAAGKNGVWPNYSLAGEISEIIATQIVGSNKNYIAPTLLKPAKPSYSLQAYESTGLLNTFASGFDSFAQFFEENIYLKHPFAGFLFTAAYGMGAISILGPVLATKLFGKTFVEFSQKFAELLAHGPHSEAITAGFGEGKILAAAWEGILHGPDSWLAKGFGDFWSDPVTNIFAAGVFIGLGYLVTYELKVPFLSKYFQEDVGKAAPIALLVIGAKSMLGIYELAIKKEDFTAVEITELKQRAIKIYKEQNDLPADHEIAIKEQIEKEVDELIFMAGLHRIFKAHFNSNKPARLLKDEIKEIYCQWKNKNTNEELLQVEVEEVNKIVTSFEKISKEKKELEKNIRNFNLLLQLEQNQELLPYLSRELKEDLKEALPQITDDKTTAESIYKGIDPSKSYAPLGNFVKSVLVYFGLTLRCVASIFTWSARPWKELGQQLKNDLTSTAYAAGKLGNTLGRVLLVTFPKVVGDLFLNLIVARVAGFFKLHSVTEWLYKRAHSYDTKLDTLKEATTNYMLHSLSREATSPHAPAGMRQAVDEQEKKYKTLFGLEKLPVAQEASINSVNPNNKEIKDAAVALLQVAPRKGPK